MKKPVYLLLVVVLAVTLSCQLFQKQSAGEQPFPTEVNGNENTPTILPLPTIEPLSANWSTFIEDTSENTNMAMVRGVKKDAQGNIYALIAIKEIDSNNLWNLYLLKIRQDGSKEWQVNVIKETLSYSFLALDNQGNIYVAGDYFIEDRAINSYKSSVNWGAPLNAYQLDARAIGNESAFIVKYNSNGDVMWNTFYNGLNVGMIALDDNNNIYLSGGGVGLNGTLAKLSSDGAVQWSKELTASPESGSNSNSHSIKLDQLGNIYVSGEISAPSGYNFVAKFQNDGTLIWTRILEGTGAVYMDLIDELEIDDEGNVYVIGISNHTWGNPSAPFLPNVIGDDPYLAKLDPNGNLLWNTFLNNTIVVSSIEVGSKGGVFISGFSLSNWGNPQKTFIGNRDGFIAQFDSNGSLVWNTFIGGAGNEKISSIYMVSDTEIYLAGASDSVFESLLMPNPLMVNDGKGGIFIISTSLDALQ